MIGFVIRNALFEQGEKEEEGGIERLRERTLIKIVLTQGSHAAFRLSSLKCTNTNDVS